MPSSLQKTPSHTSHSALESFKKIVKISVLGIGVLYLAACASPPSEGMRHKALADVMDDYMRTKDPAWLATNIGQPDKIDRQYRGYTLWRWDTAYRKAGANIRDPKTPCYQIFFIENRKNTLVGWETDCAPNTPYHIYGEIAATTPIPRAVIPQAVQTARNTAREKEEARQEAAREAARTRNATFADKLAGFMGKREEDIYSSLGSLGHTETLSNGKIMRSYTKTWQTSYYDQVAHIYAMEGLIPYTDGMVYTNHKCSYTLSFKNGIVVGYDAGDCKNYPNLGTVHYKTPVAPWKAL